MLSYAYKCLLLFFCFILYIFGIFLQFDWKNYPWYFHFSKEERSSKEIELKGQEAICLLSHLHSVISPFAEIL